MAKIPKEFFILEREMEAVKPIDEYPDNHPDLMRLRLMVGMSIQEQKDLALFNEGLAYDREGSNILIDTEFMKVIIARGKYTYKDIDDHVFGRRRRTGDSLKRGTMNPANVVRFSKAMGIDPMELIHPDVSEEERSDAVSILKYLK